MNCNYKVKIKDIQNKYQFKIFCKTYDDTGIQEDIEALQDDVEALQEENLYLNSLVEQAFDKKEVEGEELSINDTINAKMEVGLLGNTTQETTTGKQLFDGELELGSINASGNVSTDNALRSKNYIKVEPNTQYTISNDLNYTTRIYEYDSNKDYLTNSSQASTTYTFTTSSTTEYIRFRTIETSTQNNLNVKVMLNTGSTASSYEKYTGGIASPNPNYKMPVNVVTGDNTIVVSNKNLFDVNNLTNNYRLDSNGQPYADNGYALTDYIKVQPNTQYTRNIDFAWNVPICLYDMNKNFISRIQTGKTITTTNDTYYIRTVVTTADINIAQLEKSSTATSFVEHQEQTFQVNLGNIQFNGIGEYVDYPYKNGDKWYKKEYIGKVVLDGNITGSIRTDIQNENTICFRTDAGITNILSNSKPISNYFIAINDTSDVEHIRYIGISGYRFQLFLSKQKATTANEVITWLSTHNTEVYYVKATATDIEITDTTLIEQLEELKTAMSYAEQTNISQINDDIPFILKITALASYNSRIVALENAILNANRSTPVENTRKSNEVIEEPKEEVVDDNKDENIIKEEK